MSRPTEARNGKAWVAKFEPVGEYPGGWFYDNVPFDQASWPAGPYASEAEAKAQLERDGHEYAGTIEKPYGGAK